MRVQAGAEVRYAFSESRTACCTRISIFTGLPLSSIGRRGRACRSAHWGVPDPAEIGTDAEVRYAFSEAHRMLYARISIFTSLPLAAGRLALQERVIRI